MYLSRLRVGLRSIWEPGKKALTPISTDNPPLTLAITVPSNGKPFSQASEILSHALRISALSLERTKFPKRDSSFSR